MEKHGNLTLVAVADDNIGPLGEVIVGERVVATGKILIEEKFYQSVGHIEDVIVDREFRGEGIGKEIILGLVEIGKRSDCYKVILECHNDVRNFYLKCGYLIILKGNKIAILLARGSTVKIIRIGDFT